MSSYRLLQASRARTAKAQLLPMSRETANSLSLRYRLCLDQLRQSKAERGDLDALTVMLLYASGVSDNGFGGLTHAETDAAQAALNAAYQRARESSICYLDEGEFQSVGHVLAIHERQLLRAPISVIGKVEAEVSRLLAKIH